jgi:molecular chaperone DnaK
MNVGIDLGTTYSLIARLGPDGLPTLFPDSVDRTADQTPSAVHIEGKTAMVGSLVDIMAEENPDLHVLRYFKRNFGEGKPLHFDSGNAWYAESVAALLLRKLVMDAETASASRVRGAVITVPAHFNDVQRKAVIAAASLADLPVLGLIEEPVAAAIHYGVQHASTEQILLVYDFGGGTFDATVLSLDEHGIYVLAKEGVTDLGGKELDEKIGEMILQQFDRAGILPRLNARTLLQLRRISEEIKIALCAPEKNVDRRVVILGADSLEVRIHRSDFEREIAGSLERTEAVLRRCVSGAGLKLTDMDVVLLVGGTSLVRAVAEGVRRMMGAGAGTVRHHEPMHAVAFGAAMHTAQLTGKAEEYDLPPITRGVTGYHVGVRIVDQRTHEVRVEPMIKKNMPLPASAKKTLYTRHDGQERIVLDIVQYMSEDDEMIALGRLVVALPVRRANYPIEVRVENNADGTVSVYAHDPQTHQELQQTFKRDLDDVFGQIASQRTLVRATSVNTG